MKTFQNKCKRRDMHVSNRAQRISFPKGEELSGEKKGKLYVTVNLESSVAAKTANHEEALNSSEEANETKHLADSCSDKSQPPTGLYLFLGGITHSWSTEYHQFDRIDHLVQLT